MNTADPIPWHKEINWSDPNDVPDMVSWVMLDRVGNIADCLDDEEYQACCVAAVDAMPQGREAIIAAIEGTARHYAEVNGWTEWTVNPHSGQEEEWR